jgi:glycosyltransferase involved in cell wall biosynthesis
MTLRIGLDARYASARYDGVGRYVAALADELVRSSAAPVLCLLRPAPGDPPRHPLPSDGEHVITVPPGRATRAESLWSHLEVPHLAHAANADVWHTPFQLAPMRTGVPSVVTLHDCIPERFPQYFGAVRRIAYRSLVAMAVRHATIVVVPSEQTAEDARRFYGVPAGKVRLVALGVAPASVADAAAESAMRQHRGLDVGYVLIVGRPRPHKGYCTLVRALARLDATRRPLLVRVGRRDPRLPDGSEHLAESLGVRMMALADLSDGEMLAVYRGALLVAIPSLAEGFGLPLLEALAAGTPVLAADIQPFRAVGGDVVRLVGDTDDAWTEALQSAINDRAWHGAAQRAGPLQASRFPWSACADATLDVYREAARR